MARIKKENKIDYEDFPEGPLDFWENYQGLDYGNYKYSKKCKGSTQRIYCIGKSRKFL